MRVYLCRHAEAAPGDPDDLRELTPAGLEQARALGERLAALPQPPRLVLTSPLVEEALEPGATAERLAAALAGGVEPVATVGHQPDCSEIALAVLGHDPGFAVGSMVELELPG
jgi:phosphohistidine phosphatase SixA